MTASMQEILGARFRENVRKAGGLAAGDPQKDRLLIAASMLRVVEAHDAATPASRYIELEEEGTEKVVTIRRRSGAETTFHFRPTYGDLQVFEITQAEMQRLRKRLYERVDPDDSASEFKAPYAERKRLRQELTACTQDMMQIAFPDMAPDLLADLAPDTAMEVLRIFNVLMAEAQEGGHDPKEQGEEEPPAA